MSGVDRATTERGQRRGKAILVYAFVVPTAVQLLSKVIDNVQAVQHSRASRFRLASVHSSCLG